MLAMIRRYQLRKAHEAARREADAYARRPAGAGWSVTIQMALDMRAGRAARAYAAALIA